VESARALLEAGDDEVTTVARRSGFGSAESMRRAFVRAFGVAPAAYRAGFRTTGITKADASVASVWPEVPTKVSVSPPA